MHAHTRLFLSLILLPAISQAAGARVCVESDAAARIDPPMLAISSTNLPDGIKLVPGASGNAYLEIPEGRGNPPAVTTGKAALFMDLPADGAYTLWCRVYWEGECSNSFSVQIDDHPIFLFGEDATFKTWHWVRYPVARTATPLVLTKGSHTFTFLNREDGVRLDQVLVSADKRFVPVDQEPVGVTP